MLDLPQSPAGYGRVGAHKAPPPTFRLAGCPRPRGSKLHADPDAAISACGFVDGATVSFHHHLDVAVDSIGDAAGIASGTRRPVEDAVSPGRAKPWPRSTSRT